MNPITGGLAAIGFGMQLFGGIGASRDAAKISELSRQKIGIERENESSRHEAMLLAANRSRLEIVRNNQRARAMSITAATSQGAQFGTGLAGGLAQVDNSSRENMVSNNQQLAFGNELYENNQKISDLNWESSFYQSSQATNQGMASLGGSIMGASGTIGKISQGFGGLFK